MLDVRKACPIGWGGGYQTTRGVKGEPKVWSLNNYKTMRGAGLDKGASFGHVKFAVSVRHPGRQLG